MKLTAYSLVSILILVLLARASACSACGVYAPTIPQPQFFKSSLIGLHIEDLHKAENLRLWQELTDNRIPLSDIDEAVYEHNAAEFYDYIYNRYTKNKFYIYLKSTNDSHICRFLYCAKRLWEQRAKNLSPWYYPKSNTDYNKDFDWAVEIYNDFYPPELRDRYALLATRALYSACENEKCIAFVDSAFAKYPNDNLFKRMARGYQAGCWTRLGQTDKANEYFAAIGDLHSLSCSAPLEYLADRNPDAPLLIAQIQRNVDDSYHSYRYENLANRVIRAGRAKNMGDWYFLLAYLNGDKFDNQHLAGHYIDKALKAQFSTQDLADHALAYSMLIHGSNCTAVSLVADIKWFNDKIDVLDPNIHDWRRMLQKIAYNTWVPALWERGDYATAIMVAGYADNTLAQNPNDYGNLSFRLMETLTAQQLAAAKQRIDAGGELYAICGSRMRTDTDYWNELTGTLALRQGQYAMAQRYLSKVSREYICSMPVYTFLKHAKVDDKKLVAEGYNIKLQYARHMSELENAMKSTDPDVRGMAMLEYSLARYNSHWALTAYEWGYTGNRFDPESQYKYICDTRTYEFLYSYDRQNTENRSLCNLGVERAMEIIRSDEVKARAYYKLYALKTIIRHYPNTEMAAFLRRSCDLWQEWL